jgi:hypothetical protein
VVLTVTTKDTFPPTLEEGKPVRVVVVGAGVMVIVSVLDVLEL